MAYGEGMPTGQSMAGAVCFVTDFDVGLLS